MKYTVRPKAWLDLEETMMHLRVEANEETAIRFWQRAQETFEELARQPGVGRSRPDLKPAGLRSWRVTDFEKWLVFYMTRETAVEIIRVRHGMMDLQEIFAGDENA
jgi:plasmid stabilization system protein ParE